MKKNELIEQLNAIHGNPEVFIKTQDGRNTLMLANDAVELCFYENTSNTIYTSSYSHDGIDKPCIVLWVESIQQTVTQH